MNDWKDFIKLVFSKELFIVLLKGAGAYVGMLLSVGPFVQLFKGEWDYVGLDYLWLPLQILLGLSMLFAVFGYYKQD